MSFIDGLSSGLDTSTIISQMLQIERRPQVALDSRRSEEESARAELSGIRSDISSLRTMAADLRLTTGWNKVKATSSDEESVSVQATSATTTGSSSFQVTALASAASTYSTATYASTDTVIATPGTSSFTAGDFEDLGFQSLSGSGFTEGDISFSVVQDSAAAEVKGVGIPTIPIEIDGSNDGIDFEVNGFSFSVTLSPGVYSTEEAMADALKAAIAADPVASQLVGASLTGGNQLSISSLAEGSDYSITMTGGSGLADLGFSIGDTDTGVDGVVEVNGTQTSVSDTTTGTSVVLATGGAGSITGVIDGPIRLGTADVAQTGVGTGSLTDVVTALNGANLGYRASAVNTGAGYRLQLTADETGAASAFTPEPVLLAGIGFTQLSAGADAQLTVQGDNPFTISSSTNTFESLLPGVDVTVKQLTAGPVTVSSERDVESITSGVQGVVDKLNEILGRIASSTSNQPGTDSVLQGNRTARRAADQLRNALVGQVESSALTSVGVIGIELTRDGTLTFDSDRFADAYSGQNDEATKLFIDRSGGIGEPGALDRLISIAEDAASSGDGYLFTAGQASDRRIDSYGRQIDAFERRFVSREANLRRTFANLEVALSGLQQQSGFLASQLSSLGGA